ncbi:hypothetical protein [Methylomonas koyamae]|uniref:hypothetical protein n=1 Tax=Methylomonas koyamae TaxID=702114 RepID=UPI00112BF67B|nr:hypothetical protein [Methylomonas koyamae]TPQ28950.1 hypothetical protein C2U68_03040 [Methylomonas koyamae]
MSNTKYVRINPRTQLTTRHRAGIGFSQTWKQVDVDAATLEAIEEDPYLEVTDHPTVLVELPAVSQIGAIEAGQEPNNTPESTATDEGSTGETAAEGTDTGTASPVANTADADADNENPTERDPEAPAPEGLATGDEIKTGGDAPAADAADAGADGTAATDGEQPANTAEKTEHQHKIDVIKAAIQALDVGVADNWVADGKPKAAALTVALGYPVTAEDRDEAWAQIQSERSAG